MFHKFAPERVSSYLLYTRRHEFLPGWRLHAATALRRNSK